MSGPVLEVEALTKRFGKFTAVDAVSFSVARGVTAALLGANGAGKTTTMAMILGLLLPSAGSVRIFGSDLAANRYALLPRMNFSSPYTDLPHRLTVRENLTVYAKLYGLDSVRRRIERIAETLDLGDFSSGPRASSRRGSAPGSRSPRRCSTIPSCCCSTSPRPRSIPTRPTGCGA